MKSTLRLINGTLLALFCALPVASGAQNASAAAAEERAGTGEADEALARTIVQKADAIRLPAESFEAEVLVNTRSGGEAQEPRRYRLLSRGTEHTIIQTLEPATERGQNLLMRDRQLWLFLPSVSQPVRLSLSQRLTGQVANGDLARANFAGDYVPKLVGSEQLDGRDHHVLELVAAERGVTYPRVRYWVRADDSRPSKAEFYSLSGRLLKTCRYENYRRMAGALRPSRLVMTDALKADDESVLDYSAMKLVDLPARMFTKDYLKKLD